MRTHALTYISFTLHTPIYEYERVTMSTILLLLPLLAATLYLAILWCTYLGNGRQSGTDRDRDRERGEGGKDRERKRGERRREEREANLSGFEPTLLLTGIFGEQLFLDSCRVALGCQKNHIVARPRCRRWRNRPSVWTTSSSWTAR